MKLPTVFLGTLLATMMSSCAVQLVSDYDDQTDQDATELQREISTFVQKVENAQSDQDRSFASNQDFYKKVAVDVDALQLRAGAIQKNNITIQQVELLKENLARLALLHKHCLSAQLSAQQLRDQQQAIESHGIDASLDCSVANGASFDAHDRGGQVLSVGEAEIIKQQLDVGVGAIIALEIAKKRGEKGQAK